MATNPFTIDVYTKAFQWVGRITNPVSVAGSVKYHALSAFEIVLEANDPMVEDVLTKGTRITMQYRGASLFSGMVRDVRGSVLPNGLVSFIVESDWRVLANTLAWVHPFQPIAPTAVSSAGSYNPDALGQSWLPGGGSDQGETGSVLGQSGYLLWPNGSAMWGGYFTRYTETAVKWIIRANLATRLGRPVTTATDLERGLDHFNIAYPLPQVRMNPLSEVVGPLCESANLRLTMMQPVMGSSIIAEVTPFTTWDAPLTVGSGIVVDGSWSLKPAVGTRAVIGGPGELAARAFKTVVDATGLESEYGDVIEVLRDATGANLTWPSSFGDPVKVAKYYTLYSDATISAQLKGLFNGAFTESANKFLAEGRPVSGVQATLSETDTFHFGGTDGIQLGDTVTIASSDGQLYTDRITEAKFSLTPSEFKVEPIVGTRTDDPTEQLAQAIAALATSQRRLSTSR